MSLQDVSANAPEAPSQPFVLTAHHVFKTFSSPGQENSDTTVLKNVSLDLHHGELLSIVGPSGSGKSTLLYCLAGLEKTTSGRIHVASQDICSMRPKSLAAFRRDNFGFIFQAYNLITSLSAYENVALPFRLARKKVNQEVIMEALESVGLAEHSQKKPGQLSGGQQQRVAVARVIANKPPILFADEPTGALDSTASAAVLEQLRRAAQGNRSVVLVTHDLEAAALADRVLVIHDGVIFDELQGGNAAAILNSVHRAKGRK